MSININPFFKGAIIVQAILAAYLLIAVTSFMNGPREQSSCIGKVEPNQYGSYDTPWLHSLDIDIIAIFLIGSSAITFGIAAVGFKKESASILRHIRLAIIIEAVFYLGAISALTSSIGRFKGEIYALGWTKSGCTQLTPVVDVLYSAVVIIFVYKLPLSIIVDAYLKSIGEELTFFDYLVAWVYHVRNCIKYGRQGINFTSSFVRTQLTTRLAKSVRVSQKNDTLFREVEIGSRMFGAITLELLKENIAHKYDRHPNEIVRLTKNGNVLIVDDADVSRLNSDDSVEVSFEDQGTRLHEINSAILQDSISETRIDV